MTAPARLLGLRVQGFKSFAERTLVEFGPGISAVVGPNGSGKSNLADALRWALGEQGRSLRIRRSEDVIWAGSEKRSAQGMADVTLVLDNGDALLPVEYSVVELGRRLYRSGENDYLLNRQRVRLRDLVDLLDSANLAENAFLFIGQGMVDQALALRPEERRPLFEEVAGVRRHERRRRKAEEQLTEAEGNLARVEDILAELRPQARRLGQLAEQQATRLTAGEELAAALIVAAHARWHEAATRAADAERGRDALRAESGLALEALERAESEVAAVATSMAARSELEAERRAVHEAARTEHTALGLREGRAIGELEATARDRTRIARERAAAEADLEAHRRGLAQPVPEPDLALEAALADADRALAEGLAELGALRAASRARGDELAAVRRAEAARAGEAETARRRVDDTARRAGDEERRASASATRVAELEAALAQAASALTAAQAEERAAIEAREAAGLAADAADGSRRAAGERAATAGSALAAATGRLAALERRLADEEARGIARAARRVGGRRVDDDLGVDPGLRPAVEAALGELARAYVVEQAAVGGLGGERGQLAVRERIDAADRAPGGGTPADIRRLEDAVDRGRRRPSPGRDPARRVRRGAGAARACGVGTRPGRRRPAAAVAAAGLAGRHARRRRGPRPVLGPDGAWRLAARGPGGGRAPGARGGDARARGRRGPARPRHRGGGGRRGAGGPRWRPGGRSRPHRPRGDGPRRRSAPPVARSRRAPARRRGNEPRPIVSRPSWNASAPAWPRWRRQRPGIRRPRAVPSAGGEPDAIAAWEARLGELRTRRDRLAAEASTQDRARRDAEARRAGAEAAASLAERRIATADGDMDALGVREQAAADERTAVAGAIAEAKAQEARAREALEALLADDRVERGRLADAERAATAARERLRVTDDRARASDVAAMEARLNLESLREQVLVELAGMGEVGLRHLAEASGVELQPDAGTAAPTTAEVAGAGETAGDGTEDGGEARSEADGSAEGAALEAALERLAPTWSVEPPPVEPPTPGRLAVLRRRFHELGAANPFAVDEYRSVRDRLETLEAQHRDLRDAIARTRSLIADLDELIATQFRSTFAALEVAFDARFQQLFGGGFARLSLTDPTDLATTGIEITARPPGKKPQALAMLSGGERALTAVALLFAMLEVRPAPFCVLDEVDAALDEANVGRFTEALQSLAQQTQFIVITHNRGTIEVADALYGVTVGDDSVSRVISLRLDEAQAIADDRRSEARAVLAGEPG